MRFLAICLLFCAACTPAEVTDWWQEQTGEVLAPAEAETIAELATRDCLPGYDADTYVECAIKDSWERYNVPVGLETWARIAWCESGLNPTAKNPNSSATGLFQNLRRYWDGRAAAAGFPDGDIFNARVHAMVSAHLAATSGVQHWNPSGHCW